MAANIDYDELINRIVFFRNMRNLSARETSIKLGYNAQFLKTIENKSIELKARTLLDFCDVTDITLQDFVYLGKNYNPLDKQLLEEFSKLSDSSKQTIMDLIKKLQ